MSIRECFNSHKSSMHIVINSTIALLLIYTHNSSKYQNTNLLIKKEENVLIKLY